ncbi:MAG: TonB-dependent receptor, partial [Bryobacteraceae bacterium]
MQGLRHLLVILLLGGLPLRALDVVVHGRVVDENAAPVAGARITLRPGPLETHSGPTGTFTLTLPALGNYVIHVDRNGYYEIKDHPVEVEGSREITLVMNTVREVFQSMDVNERPSPVDLAQTQKEERLSGTIVNDIPYPASHSLRNSMKLMPGVVQDSTGALHFNGSSEDQVLYLLNGFNITDPITGGLQTRLGMEGVRSLQYSSGLYSPEFGKGSAGALAIRTNSGADEFRYTATNFFPGADMQQGIRLGDWYPRFGVSGPIVRRRAWFADNIDAEYNQAVVSGLPKGANTRSGWAGGNLLHTQVNVTPSNILFADFLVNMDHQGRVGLGPLDPVSTTLNLRSRQYFASVKDQAYLGRGALIEFGYAHNYVVDRQFSRGQELYVVSPGGRSGNHFQNFNQTASRDQFLLDAYLPAFKLAGTHQIKTGADANRLHYTGDFRRTGYEIVGLTGQLLSKTMYQGPAFFGISDTEMSFYVLDSWRINKRLQLDLGVRHDWDQQIRDHAWSPRIAFSWSPFATGRTRVSGGYAVTHDAVNFNLLGRPMDQVAATVQYNADGTPTGPASMATFARGSGQLRLPRGTNWSLGVDHQLKEHLFASAYYLRRRGTEGFTFVNAAATGEP